MKEKIIRSLKISEINSLEEDGKRYIYGFIPYNKRSQRICVGYSPAQYEVLDPKVFRKTLGDNANVFANFSHDSNKILGSTKSGTLQLEDTPEGLNCRCLVPNTTWGNDAYEMVSNKIVTTMSFEFIPYDWVENGNEVLLRSAKLDAVSFCVSEPAYLDTDSYASFRSIMQKRNIDVDGLANAIEKGEVNDDVKNLAKALNDLIAKNTPVEQLEDLPVEEKAVEAEQPNDIQTENTQTETKAEIPVEETEEYKAKLEELNQLENELSQELQTI